MKAGWDWVSVGDFAKTGAGGTPLKGKSEFYDGGEIPWLLSGEVCQRDIFSTKNFITQDGLRGSSAKLFPAGSVLIAMYGATAGQAGILRFEAATNQAVCAVLPNSRYVPEYLYYFLLLEKGNLVSQAVGNAQPNISQGKIRETLIPLPPLDEQKRIVAVLDAAFAGLSRARAHTETNLQNARELFESVLRVSAETDAAKFGTVTVAELALEVTDGDHMPPPKAKTGIPFVTISDVRKDTREIDFSNTFMVPERYFNDLKDKRRPRTGDILYTVTGATLGIPILIKDDRPFCFQRHIGLVRPKALVNSEWLYFMMMSPYVFSQADGGATGAAQRTVSLSVLRGFTVPKIPLERQTDLAASFRARWEASFTIAAHYRAKLADLDALRQALLQKAFAGELT